MGIKLWYEKSWFRTWYDIIDDFGAMLEYAEIGLIPVLLKIEHVTFEWGNYGEYMYAKKYSQDDIKHLERWQCWTGTTHTVITWHQPET